MYTYCKHMDFDSSFGAFANGSLCLISRRVVDSDQSDKCQNLLDFLSHFVIATSSGLRIEVAFPGS